MHAGYEYLSTLTPTALSAGKREPSLEPVCRVLAALGNPQDRVPGVIIGGTNGKGTVCSFIAAMLIRSGRRVAQFASPHLTQVTERYLIDGAPIDPETFGKALLSVKLAAMGACAELSQFEAIIAASYLESTRAGIEFNVVEVGLGGRLDATNTMSSPRAAVITSIGLDHTEILGATVERIAWEKAHIFRREVPVFVAGVSDGARAILEEFAAETSAPIEFVAVTDDELLPTDELVADHQRSNAVLAKRVGLELGLDERSIRDGIRAARWPGRVEHFSVEGPCGRRKVLIDGAHNPDGAAALCQYIQRRFGDEVKDITLVVSLLRTKDWRSVLEILGRELPVAEWILTQSSHTAALTPRELGDFTVGGNVTFEPSPPTAYRLSLAGRSDLVCVTGSLYLVGELRPLMTDRPFRTLA